MDTAKIEDVVTRMLDIRDRKAQIKAEYEAQVKKLDEMEEKGENWLMAQLQAIGVDSVSTAVATVFTTTKMRSSIGDWTALSTFIRETGEVDLLQHRISDTNLKSYLEANENQLPPGVNTANIRTLNIRRK